MIHGSRLRSAIVTALFAATSLRAQTVTSSVDLTAANTHYGDTFSGSSFAVSPALHVDTPLSTFDAGATYSTLAGTWSAQGNAGASLYTPRVSSFMGEFAGYTGGSANGDGTHTGIFSGMLRAHVLNQTAGAWLGAGGGRVWDGTLWRNLIQGEAGAWTNIPYGTLSAVVTPSKLGDTIKYTDAEGTLSVFHDRAGVDVDAGFRTGSSLPIVGGGAKVWGSANVSYWITRSVALIVGAGTYPVNVGQGFPGGRYISAGIRIGRIPGWRSSDSSLEDVAPRPITDVAIDNSPSASATRELITRFFPGKTTLSVNVPGATRVEVAGDFSNWDPVSLTKGADGRWSTTLPLKPGIYEMNLRVNGGRWTTPPGLPSKNDEFGQSVGLLIVPSPRLDKTVITSSTVPSYM